MQTLAFRIPTGDYEILRRIAEDEDRTLSYVTRRCIHNELSRSA